MTNTIFTFKSYFYVILISGLLIGGNVFGNNKESEKTILLPGKFYKALTVAYSDFSKKLVNYPKGTPELLTKIEHYNIEMRQSKQTVIIIFNPIVDSNNPIAGGGSQYIVDIDKLIILQKVQYK